MSCWTLWKRMPPRYQLTMRDIRTDDQDPPTQGTATATPSRVSSPKIRTSRTGTRPPGSARRRRSAGEAAVLTSGVVPEDSIFSEAEFSLQSPVLPPRSSSYIHNMKNQMRINSARRKMHEGTYVLTSPTTLSYTPKPRATTAPAFPITDPSNTDQYHRLTSPRTSSFSPRDVGSSPRPGPLPQRGFSGKKTPQRPSSGYSGVVSRRHVPIRTLCPFGQTPQEVTTEERSYRRSSPTQQDCVIGDYQVAALYVDNGRVTFFRKTKPDMTQSVYSTISPYNVTRDDGSYLSHLRKAYLNGVRDLPKLIPAKEPVNLEKHSTIQERMDYDRKVGRILDYYSQVDVPTGLRQTLHQAPPEARQTRPTSPSFPAARHAFRTPSSRGSPRVLASSEVRDSGSQVMRTDPGGPGGSGSMNSRVLEQSQLPVSEDRGGFLSINAKARLHRRHQFYLRTPASPVQPPHRQESAEDCVCGMCRLEMEVALMAQLHQDLGVSVDAATAARIRSTLEGQGAGPKHSPGHTSSLDAVGAGDSCPARPNSVSESRRSAAPSEVSAHQGMEPGSSASQPPTTGPVLNTATQTAAAVEPTSLTVTLPAIEEVSDGTHVLQDNEIAEPSSTNPKATDTMERAVVVQNEKQEMLKVATDEELVKNSEQKVPDTIQMKDSVKNPECTSGTLTGQDSVKTSEQETSDTSIDKTVEKKTPVIDTDETSVKNSEHGIKTDDASVKDSMKNSELETFDSDAEKNLVKNSEQETCNPLGANTVAEKPVSYEEKEPEPITDITEHENKLQSNTDANNPLLPDASLSGSPSHSNPPADLTENTIDESTSAEHDNVPYSNCEPENSTPCNHDGRTVTEASSNANAPATNDNGYEKIQAGNQIPGDALPCDSDAQGTAEGGTAPAPKPSPGEAVINSTVGMVPEEDGGMDTEEALPNTPLGAGRNTKEALHDTPLECNPPTIVISLASDNEDDVTNDKMAHTST